MSLKLESYSHYITYLNIKKLQLDAWRGKINKNLSLDSISPAVEKATFPAVKFCLVRGAKPQFSVKTEATFKSIFWDSVDNDMKNKQNNSASNAFRRSGVIVVIVSV